MSGTGDELTVTDLGSNNGTRINGVPCLEGEIMYVEPGDTLVVEVLEGKRPVLEVPVASIAETLLGSPAFMRMDSLNRDMAEWGRVSGAYLRVDSDKLPELYEALKETPSVAGVTRRDDARAAMQKLMDTGAGAMRFVMAAIAGVITFGIVYNTARIAFGEQARDLASLRVIGFTKGETAFILLGELAIVVLLAILSIVTISPGGVTGASILVATAIAATAISQLIHLVSIIRVHPAQEEVEVVGLGAFLVGNGEDVVHQRAPLG